jgi:hypothetical protein
MATDAKALALQTALTEIKNACPGISNIFLLDENNDILAQDPNTTRELVTGTTNALSALVENAAVAGGIDFLTLHGTESNISFTRCQNNYAVTVTTPETDDKTITSLTRILIPTILKLSNENIFTKQQEKLTTPPKPKPPTQTQPKPPPVNVPPASEFLVKTISGLSIISSSAETIRVDRALLGEWKELYGDKKIEEATVENKKTGKTTRCKFQPIKDAKLEGQGMVQIPDVMQANLGLKKGEVVRIRPVVKD